MEGRINKAYVSDNGEEIDYAYLDDTVDMEFYRSKLVIDFSKENICDNRNDNHRSKHITDRVEFETAHKSPEGFSQNSFNEQRNETNQHYIINKRNQFCLICLYGFGLLVISIGIILLVAGSINNSIGGTEGT